MTAEQLEIHVLADSTGESAARIARAASAQFSTKRFTIVRHRKVATTGALMQALEQIRAAAPHAAVCRAGAAAAADAPAPQRGV